MQLRIKEFREQRGLTLAQLGELVKRDPSTIFYYETGKIKLNLQMLTDIAKALDVPVSTLWAMDEEPEKETVNA